MRDSMIYFRNNPSILFWEAGNTGIPAEHMQQMVELRKEWDPHGGRVMGCRTLEDPRRDADRGILRRDDWPGSRGPTLEITDRICSAPTAPSAAIARRSSKRKIFATKRPGDFGTIIRRRILASSQGRTTPITGIRKRSALAAASRYWDYWINRISNPDPAHSKWSGYASIYFSDSNADGRQQSSETCRVSGKVDAVRLPKEIYFAHRVMQNDAAGHSHSRATGLIRRTRENGLRHCQHASGRAVSERQIARKEHRADRWICVRVPRHCVSARNIKGGRL